MPTVITEACIDKYVKLEYPQGIGPCASIEAGGLAATGKGGSLATASGTKAKATENLCQTNGSLAVGASGGERSGHQGQQSSALGQDRAGRAGKVQVAISTGHSQLVHFVSGLSEANEGEEQHGERDDSGHGLERERLGFCSDQEK